MATIELYKSWSNRNLSYPIPPFKWGYCLFN
jgi:ribosomal protein S6